MLILCILLISTYLAYRTVALIKLMLFVAVTKCLAALKRVIKALRHIRSIFRVLSFTLNMLWDVYVFNRKFLLIWII